MFGEDFVCASGTCGKIDVPCNGASCCLAPDQICPTDGICCSGTCDGDGNCCPLPGEVCGNDDVCCQFGCDGCGSCLLNGPCDSVTCEECEVCVDGVCEAAGFCCAACLTMGYGPNFACGEEGECLCIDNYVYVFGPGCLLENGFFCDGNTDCASGRCVDNECQPCIDNPECSATFDGSFTCEANGYCSNDVP